MGVKILVATFTCALIAWELVAANVTNETPDGVGNKPHQNPLPTNIDNSSADVPPTVTSFTEKRDPSSPANSNGWRPHFATPVRGQPNIFFTETSCFTDPLRFVDHEPRLVLSQMSACALESSARANPNASVFLLYTCRLYPESVARSSSMIAGVFEQPNVFVWYPSMAELFADSPLAALLSRIPAAQYPNHDASDLLRTLVLWKYGGIYLDLDVIVLRSFDALPRNFIGLNGPGEVNNAVLAFAADGVGHTLAGELLEEIRVTYDGLQHYAFNGPAAVLRWLKRKCRYQESRFEDTSSGLAVTGNLVAQDCGGMTLLPNPVIYPVYVKHTGRLFEERGSDELMTSLRHSTVVHLYASTAKLTGRHCVRKHSRQPMMLLQGKYCPAVYDRSPLGYHCAQNGATKAVFSLAKACGIVLILLPYMS